MLRLMLGRAGSGKTGRIVGEINEHISAGDRGLIMVVPEQYSHDAERLLCDSCGDCASLYAEVLSFTRICTRVFSELGGVSDKFIDDAGKMLVMSRALEIESPHMKVYGGVSRRSEFISRLVETAKECRSTQITVKDILKTADCVSSSLRDKLSDLAVVLDIYWSLLEKDIKDPDEKLDRLAELLPQSNLSQSGHIWIDGFDDFTVQQLRVIEELMIKDYNITVCLTCDSLHSDDIIFSAARNTALKLSSIAARRGKLCKVEHMPECMTGRAEELKYLEANLFDGQAKVYEGDCKAISAYICHDIAEECELAAAKAIDLVKMGARWREIAIAAGNYEKYSGIGESIFEKYEIPVYQDKKTDILKMAPALALSSALRILSSGWDYESMFTYFKTGFSGLTVDECDRLENYVLLWNIRGSMWYRGEEWSLSQDGYKAPADPDALEAINQLREKGAKPLISLNKSMKAAETNADRLKALYKFMEDISLFENLESYAQRFEKSGDRRMAECCVRLGSVLTEAMEQFYSVAGECQSSLEDFIYQWELLLSKYDMGAIPTSADSVTFGDLSRLKKRGIKHFIIIGMTEDDVPHISQSDGIFTDAERDELTAAQLGLNHSTEERLFGDIASVYDAVTMPSETLTLCCPEKGSGGETITPSYLFDTAVRILNIKIKHPVTAEYKTAAFRPCLEFAGVCQKTDPMAAAAAEYLKDTDQMSTFLETVSEAAKLRRPVLLPENAKLLYGGKITMTASRVDKYKSCRFSYFMQYGLRAKPRTPAEFDASVIGTFMHYILENVTREVETAGGFAEVTDEVCTEITAKYVAAFVENQLQNMADKTSRFKYLFNVLTEDAVSVVLNMAAELRKSDFKPIDFELNFSHKGDLPPYELSDGENIMSVSGIVDRVDGWVHDGKLYVRVVDYKTGHKTFSLSDIWYGMGMQMLIYLFALEAMGKSRYKMEIVPSGVLYAPAREVLLSESRYVTDEELEKNRLSSLKRSGILWNDQTVLEAMEHGKKDYLPVKITKDGGITGDSLVSAEQLGILVKHINKVVLEISGELLNGDIAADPYFRNQVDNSCMYCDYYDVCNYDEKRDGRARSLTKLKSPEVWEKMRKETQHG